MFNMMVTSSLSEKQAVRYVAPRLRKGIVEELDRRPACRRPCLRQAGGRQGRQASGDEIQAVTAWARGPNAHTGMILVCTSIATHGQGSRVLSRRRVEIPCDL
jgi:hypothetical protein